MAKFTVEQAADVLAIQQAINDWSDELDQNDGLTMKQRGALTDDVQYNVGGEWRDGIDAVQAFYTERKPRLAAAGGVPVMRHIISNFRTSFVTADHAKCDYLLLFFAKAGTPPFTDYCDPIALAEVQMEARREADGEWRISRFDSGQIFRRG